eukprot:Unigene4446_Nuclearia_a/m.13590 Unigene4446_Nuclearia_a/g.13590  ORF Unigene4446_Nuclearia_a/g.13590 Unigene4446_Nuclearia_a/m.13590 type:complete len:308 (+) Unigene4446_Nuclearia_a:486-1409(+)
MHVDRRAQRIELVDGRGLGFVERVDKGNLFERQHAAGLRAAVAEEARRLRLIHARALAHKAVVGQLQAHLDPRVRALPRDVADKVHAVLVVLEDLDVGRLCVRDRTRHGNLEVLVHRRGHVDWHVAPGRALTLARLDVPSVRVRQLHVLFRRLEHVDEGHVAMRARRRIERRVLGVVAHAAVGEEDALGRLVKVAQAALAVERQARDVVVRHGLVLIKHGDRNGALDGLERGLIAGRVRDQLGARLCPERAVLVREDAHGRRDGHVVGERDDLLQVVQDVARRACVELGVDDVDREKVLTYEHDAVA